MGVFDPVVELKAKFSNVNFGYGEEKTMRVYECSPSEVLEIYKIMIEPPISSDGSRVLKLRDVGLMINGERYPYLHLNSVMCPKEEPDLGYRTIDLGFPILYSRIKNYVPSPIECTTIKLKEGDRLEVYASADEAMTNVSFTITMLAARARGADVLAKEAGSVYDASFTLDSDVYSKPSIAITPATFNELPGGVAQSKPAIFPWATYARNAVATTPNVWYDFDYPNFVEREWQDLSFNLVDKSKAYLIKYLGVIPDTNSSKTRIYVEGRETNPEFITEVEENFFVPARDYNVRPVKSGRVVTISVAAGSTALIPAGAWSIICSTNTKIQVFNGSSWVDFTAAGAKVFLISDGINFRFSNGGASAENQVLVSTEHKDIKKSGPCEIVPPRLLHGVKGGIQHIDNGTSISPNGVEVHVYGVVFILR